MSDETPAASADAADDAPGEPITCLRCGGAFEPGFLLDNAESGQLKAQSWAPGVPQKSFWTGIRRPSDNIEVVTFRCTTCGYLESYAPRPPQP